MKKEPTKKELQEWIKNERNVFLNGIFDLLNQRKELEQKVQRLQEQLEEANDILELYFPIDKKINSICIKPINDYRRKWGVK